jgi:exo-1,4-beta-D-glucosaminidase
MNFQKKNRTIVLSFIFFSFLVSFGCTPPKPATIETVKLDTGWLLQPSGKWSDDGQLITPDVYSPENEISGDVPTTIFAAMVKSGKYKDPFFADNLEHVPDAWFKTNWRYLKAFEVSEAQATAFSQLCFDGINYSADIFLNEIKIASADTLKGAFRIFQIDVSGKLKIGKNVLDVRVFPPKPGDFTIGFVDWTPEPPDKNMGLWRGVRLQFSGAVSIEHPFINSKVNPENQNEAALTIESWVVNHSAEKLKTTVRAQIENVSVSQDMELNPGEKKLMVFTPEDYPVLNFKNARLWWPWTMGDPNLYQLKLSATSGTALSDSVLLSFGIREVSDYVNAQGSRAYKVNGKDIQIRGGGWTDELLLRENQSNVEAQVQYTKLMNLNCIRLEGFWGESSTLFDLCDKYGILLMPGWSCQWEHDQFVGKTCDEFGGIETPEEMNLITKSLNDHVFWLRNHPSIFVWVLGSDRLPRPELEKMYLENLAIVDPTRPTLSACIMLTSEITGSTAVKMNGPYDYVSPNYWYIDTVNGGAFGFNTETGPGPQIPPIETLRKMFPEDKLWPINKLWDYHCGRGQFNTIENFLNALNKRYGESQNIFEFEKKAQLASYEAIRPMFESFAVNKAEAGGIIQWMLNASWPKLYWQLYDYYLMPNSAFFGTQSALKPLNIIYNYGNNGIYISNDFQHDFEQLTAEIKILDMNSNMVSNQKIPFSVKAYTSQKLADMPALKKITPVYFADLRILSADGKELSHSFYWLSVKTDVPDFKHSNWYITPTKDYADFKALAKLPKAEVKSDVKTEVQGDKTLVTVQLKNTSEKLAFFMELKAKGKTSKELILPVFWNENYVSLLPGEERTLTVKINTTDLKGDQPEIEINGFNIKYE